MRIAIDEYEWAVQLVRVAMSKDETTGVVHFKMAASKGLQSKDQKKTRSFIKTVAL